MNRPRSRLGRILRSDRIGRRVLNASVAVLGPLYLMSLLGTAGVNVRSGPRVHGIGLSQGSLTLYEACAAPPGSLASHGAVECYFSLDALHEGVHPRWTPAEEGWTASQVAASVARSGGPPWAPWTMWYLPLWPSVASLGLMAAMARRRYLRQRLRLGRCPSCGYPRDNLPAGSSCPECGQTTPTRLVAPEAPAC